MPAYFQDAHSRVWYETNAMQFSGFCLARGRYELAHELHAIGTEWYEREIVSKTGLGETNDPRAPQVHTSSFQKQTDDYRGQSQ
jgi:hypothetical protein